MEPDDEQGCHDDGRPGAVPASPPSTCAPLSRQENEVLDEIAHGLIGSDPGLFARMCQLDDPAPAAMWVRVGGGLAFAAMVLVLVMAMPAVAGWALVGLVATAVLLPWLLSPARQQDHP